MVKWHTCGAEGCLFKVPHWQGFCLEHRRELSVVLNWETWREHFPEEEILNAS